MGCNSTLGYWTVEGEAAMGYTSYAVGDGPAAGIYRVRSGLTTTIITVENGSTANKGICTLHAFKSVTTKDKLYEKDTQGIEQYENARVADVKGGNVDRSKDMKARFDYVGDGSIDSDAEAVIDTSNITVGNGFTDTVGNGLTDTAYTVGNGSAVGGNYTVGSVPADTVEIGSTATTVSDEEPAEVKSKKRYTQGDSVEDVEPAKVEYSKLYAEEDSAETTEPAKGECIEEYAEEDSVKTYIQEGGHALKSLLPEVEGGALHGTHDGGEASQIEKTSFEVLHEVRGGHALRGARPADRGHQGVSQPHHPDVGYIPTNNMQTVRMRAEEQAVVVNYYVRSTVGEMYKTHRTMELPRHRALSPFGCPEDCKGGDIVEVPVVFSSSTTARYGRSTR